MLTTLDKVGVGRNALPAAVLVIDDAGIIVDCRVGDPSALTPELRGLIGKPITTCATIEYDLRGDDGRGPYEATLSRAENGEFRAVVRNPNRESEGDSANTLSMLKATLDATADGILVLDTHGGYVASNTVFHEMWRVPKHLLYRGEERAVAKFAFLQIKNPDSLRDEIATIKESPSIRTVSVAQFHDGRFFECVSIPQRIANENVGRVWSFRDVTSRVKTEQRSRHDAYHDSLTGLPNRALFHDRLDQEVGRARRAKSNAGVLLLDLDRFKNINDTLGHAAGDRLLIEVARRLQSRKRDGDTIARLGGDEFVLVASDLRFKEDCAVIAEQLLDILSPPIVIDEHELHISASIGIAIFPHDGDDATALMKSADMALYRAKELGRDNYQIFEPKLNHRAMERLVLERDLRRAIQDNEFVLHYQPQFELKTNRLVGVEALVRWKQGDEVISPARFIPIAEECGLIVPLGSWVLKEAARQCAEFNRQSKEPLRVCVNVSALQIQRPNFANEVATVLREAKLAPQLLVVELTESALMQNPELGSYAMEQLQQMGVGIAMDDFGTGHSSLIHVSVLPISMIKIDQSFVNNCSTRKTDASILSAIVTMGRALGLKVLAEGVETQEQAQVLRDQGCDEVQGYLFGRPVTAKDLIAILKIQ